MVSQGTHPDIHSLISCAAKGKLITEKQGRRLERLLEAEGGKKRKPKHLSLRIKDCSEKALQRAIYLTSYSDLLFSDHTIKKVFWGDVEVPARSEGKSPRGSCFDLVGSTKNDGKIDVLCELKMGGKSQDSPLFATLELLAYYGASEKDDELRFHENSIAKLLGWKKAKGTQPILIVAADSAYWDKWEKPGRGDLQKLAKLCIGPSFFWPSFFKIRLSEKSGWFKEQKQGEEYYTPCLGPCKWQDVYGRI